VAVPKLQVWGQGTGSARPEPVQAEVCDAGKQQSVRGVANEHCGLLDAGVPRERQPLPPQQLLPLLQVMHSHNRPRSQCQSLRNRRCEGTLKCQRRGSTCCTGSSCRSLRQLLLAASAAARAHAPCLRRCLISKPRQTLQEAGQDRRQEAPYTSACATTQIHKTLKIWQQAGSCRAVLRHKRLHLFAHHKPLRPAAACGGA
jgi:hypothetical protein